MKHLIRPLLLVSALALSACSTASAESEPAGDRASVHHVNGREAMRLVQEQNATLVDVRTPAEYASGHPDGAINVPVQVLPGGASAIDPSRPVVVYCRSGARSARAASMLAEQGYEVHDLGSVGAWPSDG